MLKKPHGSKRFFCRTTQTAPGMYWTTYCLWQKPWGQRRRHGLLVLQEDGDEQHEGEPSR